MEYTIDARTGTKLWTYTLTGMNGAPVNNYDQFSYKSILCKRLLTTLKAWEEISGARTWTEHYDGTQIQQHLWADPGIESPYGIWPLWTFGSSCISNDVGYWSIGHEYDPPLFHGAQLCAVNATDGKSRMERTRYKCYFH